LHGLLPSELCLLLGVLKTRAREGSFLLRGAERVTHIYRRGPAREVAVLDDLLRDVAGQLVLQPQRLVEPRATEGAKGRRGGRA